jgi:tRNA(fMet)-specific endonuclease VapC
MICLDTNVIIAILNSKTTPVRERLRAETDAKKQIAISSLVFFELWYGVGKSMHPERNEMRIDDFMSLGIEILEFDAEDAREAGLIRALLVKAGTPIGPYDVLIAAQARRRDAVLVTANSREFSRVLGLKIEDWTVPVAG